MLPPAKSYCYNVEYREIYESPVLKSTYWAMGRAVSFRQSFVLASDRAMAEEKDE